MTKPLSPAAQAVLDAYETSYIESSTESGLAAALRAVVDNWKSEISGQPSTEFIQGINNCIAALQEIAADLEGHQ